MALPPNAPRAYQSGYKAASAAINRRKGKSLPISTAECKRWASTWTDYLAGWKQAVIEVRDRACRWETQI